MTPEQPGKSQHPVVLQARRSWERRRFVQRVLMIPIGAGVVYGAGWLGWGPVVLLGIIAVFYAVIQAASAGFGLLTTIGTHRLEMKEARLAFDDSEQMSAEQKTELQQLEVGALVSRERAQRERMLEVWRTSRTHVLWLLGTGAVSLSSFFGAFELAMEGGDNGGYIMLLLLTSITVFLGVMVASWQLLQSAQEVSDELAERRQLAREKTLLVQELEGDHLAGGLSISTGEDESLRGGLTQDASQGGLSRVD